jgi:antitoxin (DNA-binding transcriptional repressor) of toxin-antitoxin stability system
VTITKRGVPIAKPVPADSPAPFKLGTLAGRFTADDDAIVAPAFSEADWAENAREWDEIDAPVAGSVGVDPPRRGVREFNRKTRVSW